ncbi:MAG: hypothetical protein JL50_13175 [Peptococcaceae bacterium BICA1-7]|nr:MAG: hypothetical protein JL50_13175 [Peptococcaceae bacterium BICA1-7]HBV99424.1 DUF3795 domain-containing protein [Desulfotomaculum sp.]
MEKMMAYCGLVCSDCNAYKATVNNDEALRKETAGEWSKMFGADIEVNQINCLGCKSEVRFGYCGMCQIRACSTERKYDSCAQCDSFVCDKLEEILKHVPEARERLEKMRK